MSMYDDMEYDIDQTDGVRMAHVDDKYWKDARGKLHHIPHMKIDHVEACIRFLYNKGYTPKEMPKALFKRYKQRHKILIEEFEELI